jgi:hypothetical protein
MLAKVIPENFEQLLVIIRRNQRPKAPANYLAQDVHVSLQRRPYVEEHIVVGLHHRGRDGAASSNRSIILPSQQSGLDLPADHWLAHLNLMCCGKVRIGLPELLRGSISARAAQLTAIAPDHARDVIVATERLLAMLNEIVRTQPAMRWRPAWTEQVHFILKGNRHLQTSVSGDKSGTAAGRLVPPITLQRSQI